LHSLISNNTLEPGSNFQGVPRATNDWANSYVDTTAAVLTEAMIINTLTIANEFGNVDLIITTPALRDKYASLLASQKRYPSTVDLK